MSRFRIASGRVLALAAAVLVVALVGCSAKTEAPPQVRLDFEKYKLPNGLEVILRKDSRLPLVAVNVWYHVGPAREGPGRTGFAHLFEHMMFQGSGHVGPDMHFRYLEGAGASFVNGSTNFDRTNYMEDLPSNQLELALWLESDRMGFLLDRLDQSMLSNQQDVVRGERRQSTENEPYGLAQEAVYQQLFPAGHPYHAAVIGSHADIQAAKLEDVRQFFRNYYVPNNATLTIVGDIDVAQTKTLVEKYFGSLPKGPEMPAVNVETPPITAEKRVHMTDQVELPRVYMAWITAPFYKPGDAEADLAARILAGGKASRLYKDLVYTRKIAQDVSASQESATLGSIFQIVATAKPGHTVEELEAAIDHQLDSLTASGPSAEELDAAKNAIQTGIVTSLENIGGVADRLQTYNHYVGTPDYLNQDLARYGSAQPSDIQAFANHYLGRSHRVMIEVLPGPKVLPPAPPTPTAAQEAAAAAAATPPAASRGEAWRSQVPTAGAAAAATLPVAKKLTLPNGLAVYLVENHALPIVAAELVVRAGSASDEPGKSGLAGFTAAMLDEGTTRRDAITIARDLEVLGASLGTSVVRDGSTLSLRALKRNIRPALEILAEVATSPTFPVSEVERVRNDRLTALQQDRDSPFRIAATVMWTDLYGAENPYGHMTIGTEPGLEAISRDDLVRFHDAAYGPGNAALVLAGDLTEDEARKLAGAAFGAWHGGGLPVPDAKRAHTASERVLVVDRPGLPQTTLMLAQIGVARSDPDYEKLTLANQVLGGLFSSRLNMNLREEHGFTYGASSLVYDNTAPGPLMLTSEVRVDATGKSIEESLKEAKGMLDKPVTPDELKLAKESIARSLPAYFQNTSSTAGTVGDLYLYDLPPDYYQGLPQRIDGMTADQVLVATQAHLHPDQMKVIAVGDRKKIDPQIVALRLGPIGYRLPDGRPVTANQTVEKPIP
jgi:zinc protease